MLMDHSVEFVFFFQTVLISYADHDKPKAVDIALHLRFNGYNPVLDNTEEIPERERKKKCKKVFKKVSIRNVCYRTCVASV